MGESIIKIIPYRTGDSSSDNAAAKTKRETVNLVCLWKRPLLHGKVQTKNISSADGRLVLFVFVRWKRLHLSIERRRSYQTSFALSLHRRHLCVPSSHTLPIEKGCNYRVGSWVMALWPGQHGQWSPSPGGVFGGLGLHSFMYRLYTLHCDPISDDLSNR